VSINIVIVIIIILPLPLGIQTSRLMQGFLGPPEYSTHSKQHLDWFSHLAQLMIVTTGVLPIIKHKTTAMVIIIIIIAMTMFMELSS